MRPKTVHPGDHASEVLSKIPQVPITSLSQLVSTALALGAENVPGWAAPEKELLNSAGGPTANLDEIRERITAGGDPLGDAFCAIRSAEARRPQGQTYTPPTIVSSMLDWAQNEGQPARIVDPGVGSARFLVAAGRRYPAAHLIGADVDPIATLMARAHLNVAGLASRSHIQLIDYRTLAVPDIAGRTLYIGNPPYVRHHGIAAEWKQWLTRTASARGYKASQLAGLHVHFFLATLEHARRGDFGAFVTSSEWLDVNYGSLVRQLLVSDLGGRSIHVVDPKAMPFADATTTAAITCFEVGAKVPSIKLKAAESLDELGNLTGGRKVARTRLVEAPRWTPLLRVSPQLPEGYVELGELARVHRGTVTGANSVWVTTPGATRLPASVLRPSVTKARELFEAGHVLADPTTLRVVIDLPADLDELDTDERKAVERFLRRPQVKAAKSGYIASSRRSWWAVGLRNPAPLLATYMARRPPAFVRNVADARHINIAHGIYPREPLTGQAMNRLADHLRRSVTLGQGRTYAGGLTKFEPREMERLPVPSLDLLNAT